MDLQIRWSYTYICEIIQRIMIQILIFINNYRKCVLLFFLFSQFYCKNDSRNI